MRFSDPGLAEAVVRTEAALSTAGGADPQPAPPLAFPSILGLREGAGSCSLPDWGGRRAGRVPSLASPEPGRLRRAEAAGVGDLGGPVLSGLRPPRPDACSCRSAPAREQQLLALRPRARPLPAVASLMGPQAFRQQHGVLNGVQRTLLVLGIPP